MFNGHGVVAVKKLALFEELDLFETVHCPSIMAVFAGPYWATVGFVFIPFLKPLCCPNRFSTISEFRYPGLMLFCPVKNNLHSDTKPTMEEFMSVRVSEVMRFFDEICMTDLSMAFSKDVKNLVILFSVSNLGSCSDEMGWFMVQNMSTNFEVFSKSSMLDAKFCGLWRVAWYAFIK